MVWALTGWPPTLSTTAAMLAALIHLFPKHNLWIRCWARALNFFGRPWRGLFWVEPVLLNRCMVLATVLHRSFRILAIILKFTPSLCRATILFFRSSESSLPWGAMLNFLWPVWESESDNTKFNTPAPHSHPRPCNTSECFTPGRENCYLGPIWTFSLRGVLTFVAGGLDINGCVLSYFEGTEDLHCYYKLYTHYFTL